MEKQNPDLPLQCQPQRSQVKGQTFYTPRPWCQEISWWLTAPRIHRQSRRKKKGPARDRKRRSVKCRPCETLEKWIPDWSWIEMNLCIPKWSIRHRPERRVFWRGLPMLKIPVGVTTLQHTITPMVSRSQLVSLPCHVFQFALPRDCQQMEYRSTTPTHTGATK